MGVVVDGRVGGRLGGRGQADRGGAARRSRAAADFLVGCAISVCDEDGKNSFHEGRVLRVEREASGEAVTEYLRVRVERRVVDGLEMPLAFPTDVLIDTDILISRIKPIAMRERDGART